MPNLNQRLNLPLMMLLAPPKHWSETAGLVL